MDHLVAHLVAERRLDLARVASFDLVELGGAVIHEAARELASLQVDALHAGAGAEVPAHLAQPRGQEAPSLLDDRTPRAVVDDDRAVRLQRVGDPALAGRQTIGDGPE